MPLVGLTGGIAAGKSLVADYIASKGFRVINLDTIAHELYRKGTPLYDTLLKAFAPLDLDDHGEIDRKALGQRVFGDPSLLKQLNALVHPALAEELTRQRERLSPVEWIFVEAAILIDAGFAPLVDLVVVVHVPKDIQHARLLARSPALTPREADERIASQIGVEERLSHADVLIDNAQELVQTQVQIDALLSRLPFLLEAKRLANSAKP